MARTVELSEFAGQATDLVVSVAAGGDSLIVTRDGAPLAMVMAADTHQAQAALADLPRWEEWVHEVRDSIAESGGQAFTSTMPLPQPPEVEKSLLGFDPGSGTIGSDDGRDFLAAALTRLEVTVKDKAQLAEIYASVLRACEDKEHIYEPDLRLLAQETIAEAPQRLRLLAVTVTSTTGLPATAEVTLELGRGPAMRREQGDGPLDAAFKAIQRLTGLAPEVENLSVVSATRGADAMAEAVIELALEGRRSVGFGASTNAIEAGIHAYVNALNFVAEARAPV